jgi:adenosylhomocysteine nucleosidase
MIAVTFALPAESSGFLRGLRNRSPKTRNAIRTIRGTVRDREVEVLHTGVGETICRERLAKFLHDQPVEFLISAGFAGGINNELRVNDLLVAENFSTFDLKQLRSALSGFSVRSGHLLTLRTPVHSREDRQRIARESGAAAVDMETEIIAEACAAREIPLLSLRVITDTPGEPFPAPPEILFDVEQQRTRFWPFAKFFLTHPNRVPALVQFAKTTAHARNTLGTALVRLI